MLDDSQKYSMSCIMNNEHFEPCQHKLIVILGPFTKHQYIYQLWCKHWDIDLDSESTIWIWN